MKWPSDLFAHFPFKLCKKKGCNAEIAISHTLQFRQVYKPWLVTPSMKQLNAQGAFYQHGFSPAYTETEQGSHALLWIRPGLVSNMQPIDEVVYTRTVVRELELAVARSMHRSKGRVGKFNVIVSGQDFSWNRMPTLKGIKDFVTILQDHYVDRLGVVILMHMSKICELLLKLFLPLITEDVRKKIVILPHDETERRVILETVLGRENIPTWLGGTDAFEFSVDDYYSTDDVILATDAEAVEYLKLMPYHS
jgi:hypothetical protein